MNTCKYCDKPLTLTPEYDICIECQRRIMRESTIPQGAFATNSTRPQMITHEEARRFVNMKFQEKIGWAVPKQIRDPLNAYITEQQAKDKVHEELVSLVKKVLEEKRYIEWHYALEELKEYMKVGNDDV